MYIRLYDKCFLGAGADPEKSLPFSLHNANALQVEVVATDVNGTGVRVVILTVEISDDDENWKFVTGSVLLIPSAGYYLGAVVGSLTAASARVKLELDDPSYSGLLSVGINLSHQ